MCEEVSRRPVYVCVCMCVCVCVCVAKVGRARAAVFKRGPRSFWRGQENGTRKNGGDSEFGTILLELCSYFTCTSVKNYFVCFVTYILFYDAKHQLYNNNSYFYVVGER